MMSSRSKKFTVSEYTAALGTDIHAEVTRFANLAGLKLMYEHNLDAMTVRPTRIPLKNVEAVRMAFSKARADDFYPILEGKVGEDGKRGTFPFRAVRHRESDRHNAIIALTNNPTFWNLLSYRPSAIKKNDKFHFRKIDAFAVHGVFIDFDGGRSVGDKKWTEPGKLLRQSDIWTELNRLVVAGLIPPFQMWADGTRGCYGVILFDEPEMNVEFAAEEWRDIREYYYRRLPMLAADDDARAITQPLKAPGACDGIVKYYSTGVNRTSFAALRTFFQTHPHESDLAPDATRELPVNMQQSARLKKARKVLEKANTKRERAPVPRNMTPEQKVGWLTARLRDWEIFIRKFKSPGYSRRKFFLDLGSAAKAREYAFHQDPKHALAVAVKKAIELNHYFEEPWPLSKIQEQIYDADPTVHRSSEQIRRDMGISEPIAIELGLRTLVPKTLKTEWKVQEIEGKAERALARLEKKKAKEQKESEAVEERARRRDAKHAADAKRGLVSQTKKEERERKRAAIVEMLKNGSPTSEIMQQVGVHQQKVARIRRQVQESGQLLPTQVRARRGRKKSHVTK